MGYFSPRKIWCVIHYRNPRKTLEILLHISLFLDVVLMHFSGANTRAGSQRFFQAEYTLTSHLAGKWRTPISGFWKQNCEEVQKGKL